MLNGHISSYPKKSELKIGESSAFFTYVKSSVLKIDSQVVAPGSENALQRSRIEEKLGKWGGEVDCDTRGNVNKEAEENQYQGDEFTSSSIIPGSPSVERSCTSPPPPEFSQQRDSNIEELSQFDTHTRHDSNLDVLGFSTHTSYPYYISGIMNQFMMPYQNNLQDLQNHATSNMLPQYNQYPQFPPQLPQMASVPYYPITVCLPPGQMPTEQPWLSYGSSSSTDGKLSKLDLREAALLKFKQKRKERSFDKKIRYANRKQLAKKRPQVQGQLVRKKNGLNMDLNGQPTSADYDDDEDDYDDAKEQAAKDSSPEDDASVLHN